MELKLTVDSCRVEPATRHFDHVQEQGYVSGCGHVRWRRVNQPEFTKFIGTKRVRLPSLRTSCINTTTMATPGHMTNLPEVWSGHMTNLPKVWLTPHATCTTLTCCEPGNSTLRGDVCLVLLTS